MLVSSKRATAFKALQPNLAKNMRTRNGLWGKPNAERDCHQFFAQTVHRSITIHTGVRFAHMHSLKQLVKMRHTCTATSHACSWMLCPRESGYSKVRLIVKACLVWFSHVLENLKPWQNLFLLHLVITPIVFLIAHCSQQTSC